MRNGSGENTRVLIADKEPLFLHGLRAGIEGRFRVVGEADTSLEVLSLLALHQPRLLIVGFRLGCERDAIALAPEFRKRCRDTAVIVFLSRNAAAFTAHILDAGVCGILARCSPVSTLVSAIGNVLAGGVYVDPSLIGCAHDPAAEHSDTLMLTDREREIFHLLGVGKSCKDIATLLSISTKTVQRHRENIKSRLHLSTVCDLCSAAKTRVIRESS